MNFWIVWCVRVVNGEMHFVVNHEHLINRAAAISKINQLRRQRHMECRYGLAEIKGKGSFIVIEIDRHESIQVFPHRRAFNNLGEATAKAIELMSDHCNARSCFSLVQRYEGAKATGCWDYRMTNGDVHIIIDHVPHIPHSLSAFY